MELRSEELPRVVVEVPAPVATVVVMTGAIIVSRYPRTHTRIGWKTSLPVSLYASWKVRMLDFSIICLPKRIDYGHNRG